MQYLTKIDRNNFDSSDLGEKIGDFALLLLRIGFGKTVIVEEISADRRKGCLKAYSTIDKVIALVVFFLAFPLTLPFAGIGLLAVAFSKTHKEACKLYNLQAEVSQNIKNEREVKFSDARARVFDKTAPPIQLAGIESIQVEDFKKEPTALFSQERKIPPVSPSDTCKFKDGKIVSVYPNGKLFNDDEIVEKLPIVREETIKDEKEFSLTVFYTRNNKPIIHQQATRGCTAGVSAMLILDNNKVPNLQTLRFRNLGDNAVMLQDIKNAGLQGVENETKKDLSALRDLIIKNGSCIAYTLGKLGAHVIVVDEVSENLSRIRIREPYHGWEITVSKEAFLNEWVAGSVIQIEKTKV
jgi:hypothetical protein